MNFWIKHGCGGLVMTVAIMVAYLQVPGLFAQTQQIGKTARSGQQLYKTACAACHGSDGRGAAQAMTGLETPLPDFTDCRFASREPSADWMAVVHQGGPARGFSEMMPAFGEALGQEEIEKVVAYVHSFCRDRSWPRGELNLPRPLVTEKAFPEDEAVLTTSVATEGPGSVTNDFLYERRFGARNQIELNVPVSALQVENGGWRGGVGDITFEYKRVLFHSLAIDLQRRGRSHPAHRQQESWSGERVHCLRALHRIGTGAAVGRLFPFSGRDGAADRQRPWCERSLLEDRSGADLRPAEGFWPFLVADVGGAGSS